MNKHRRKGRWQSFKNIASEVSGANGEMQAGLLYRQQVIVEWRAGAVIGDGRTEVSLKVSFIVS